MRAYILATGGDPKDLERVDSLIARRDALVDHYNLTPEEDMAGAPELLKIADDPDTTVAQMLDAIEAHVSRLEASRRN